MLSTFAATASIKGPYIDWAALSPLVALTGGACLVLMVGLLRAPFVRTQVVPALALLTLLVTAGLGVWQWDANTVIVARALAIDDLTLSLTMVFVVGGFAATLMSWRSLAAVEAGEGEYYALLLSSVLGMVVLVAANDLVVLFLGFELLSIPLYVLCATHMRREHSLESGLKYLIIGSVGSATLLYGLALVYGATGATGFEDIAARAGEVSDDVLLLTGTALVVAGLAFKASVAPFHQWTPDVYEGAPTPITGFMAVATKAAAFGVLLRLFDVALIRATDTWGPAFATLAVITILVGNVGAIGQSSLKRLLAYSSVAQAGYMLAGVVVSTRLGVQATVFYLLVYVLMNLAAFAVVTVREREAGIGDDIASLYGIGAERPLLAWPMTIAMLSLAGFPATAGFFGKLYLIEAAVDNGYAWLGIVIVLGSAVSLAYYLRVVAAVWMRSAAEVPEGLRAAVAGRRPAIAGGSPEADAEGGGGSPGGGSSAGRGGSEGGGAEGGASAPAGGPSRGDAEGGDGSGGAGAIPARRGNGGAVAAESEPAGALGIRRPQPEVVFVAVVCALATVVFGIYPDPLLSVAGDAGAALASLV